MSAKKEMHGNGLANDQEGRAWWKVGAVYGDLMVGKGSLKKFPLS